jgi:hypothetical protein
MFVRFDHWLGKHMFVPIIIRICQRAKITQHRFAAYGWMVALFCLLAETPHGWFDWIMYGITVLIGMLAIAVTALMPDYPFQSNGVGFRMFVLAQFLLLDLLPLLVFGWHTVHPNTLFAPIVLFAEYAKTITTIPPLEAKEKKRAAKLARQHG